MTLMNMLMRIRTVKGNLTDEFHLVETETGDGAFKEKVEKKGVNIKIENESQST